MTKLNRTTKKAIYFLDLYKKSTMYTLNDLYNSYSIKKWDAFNDCIRRMNELNGHSMKLLSGSSFVFTCGYKAMIDGVDCLIVETASNTYRIEL